MRPTGACPAEGSSFSSTRSPALASCRRSPEPATLAANTASPSSCSTSPKANSASNGAKAARPPGSNPPHGALMPLSARSNRPAPFPRPAASMASSSRPRVRTAAKAAALSNSARQPPAPPSNSLSAGGAWPWCRRSSPMPAPTSSLCSFEAESPCAAAGRSISVARTWSALVAANRFAPPPRLAAAGRSR